MQQCAGNCLALAEHYGAMMKASMAQETVGPNPTDREKMAENAICGSIGVVPRCHSSSVQPTGMMYWILVNFNGN